MEKETIMNENQQCKSISVAKQNQFFLAQKETTKLVLNELDESVSIANYITIRNILDSREISKDDLLYLKEIAAIKDISFFQTDNYKNSTYPYLAKFTIYLEPEQAKTLYESIVVEPEYNKKFIFAEKILAKGILNQKSTKNINNILKKLMQLPSDVSEEILQLPKNTFEILIKDNINELKSAFEENIELLSLIPDDSIDKSTIKTILNLDRLTANDLIKIKEAMDCDDIITELLKKQAPESLINALACTNNKIKRSKINTYIDFFKKHEKICETSFNTLILDIISNKDLSPFIKIFDENIDYYKTLDFEVLNRVEHYITRTHIDKSLAKYFEPFFSFDYTYAQKDELSIDLGYYSKEHIIKYVNEEYSPEQIYLLREQMLAGKIIENALNPKFTLEHMKHICFYNSMNIYFDKDKDYDVNFEKDYNNAYKTFLMLAQDMQVFTRTSNIEDKIYLMKNLDHINKENNMNIPLYVIEKFANNNIYIDEVSLFELINKAIDNNVNLDNIITGEYDMQTMDEMVNRAIKNKSLDDIIAKKREPSYRTHWHYEDVKNERIR